MLGRTETRTRDRMYCQTIRTVRDIPETIEQELRRAVCEHRQTEIFLKVNYSIDLCFICFFYCHVEEVNTLNVSSDVVCVIIGGISLKSCLFL